MQVSVTFRHMAPTDALKDFAQEKVARLEKYITAPTDAHVVLSVQNKHSFHCEVNMVANGVRLHGAESTEDMYASIDRAVSKIERQLVRYRNKLANHKAREGHALKVKHTMLDQQQELVHELPAQIIETKELDARPMMVEEAIMHMDLGHQDFLVFLNAKTNGVNVLYRRKEGNYGLLEPPAR